MLVENRQFESTPRHLAPP